MKESRYQFWNLRAPDMDEDLKIDWDDGVVLGQKTCPLNPEHRSAGRRLTNLSVVLSSRQVFDVMWTGASECLIQQSVLDAFSCQGFNGFEVKPVQARFKRPGAGSPPQFWELIVTGWAGMASPKSGIRLDETKTCPGCGRLRYTKASDYSSLIDPKRWDGSDFFMVWPLPRFVFVTERVREFAEKTGLRLTQFTSPGDMQPKTPFLQQTKMGFGPGRLSYWMPEQRAHELGDSLGIY